MREALVRHWLLLMMAVSTPFLAGVAIVISTGGSDLRVTAPIAPSVVSESGIPVGGATTTVTVPSGAHAGDYVIDLRTGAVTPLPDAITRSLGAAGAKPSILARYAVSATGSRLAYVGTSQEGSAQIFIARMDGNGVRQIPHGPKGVQSPSWSPDGTSIAYEGRSGSDVAALFVFDLATGRSRRVATASYEAPGLTPQFTPDGSALLYTGGTGQAPVLRTVPMTGGKSTLLIGPSGGLNDAGNGSLSPDGSLVTFLGSGFPKPGNPSHCGPCRWIANADGTNRRVIDGECWVSNPAGTWSPDGSRIVCSDGDGSGIIILNIVTGLASRLAKGRTAIWIDQHTLLVDT